MQPLAEQLVRCSWADSDPLYRAYHDQEWGRPVHGDDALFERLTLEAFQSGLSWLTILRKRPAFRRAFADFRISAVARFEATHIDNLMADAGIVRNRAKIEAAVGNARAAAALPQGLDSYLWSFAPSSPRPPQRPVEVADLPTTSPAAVAMAAGLKRAGFRFVGPTTSYALMTAVGMVDGHVIGCFRAGSEVD